MKNLRSNAVRDVYNWFVGGLDYVQDPREKGAIADSLFSHFFSLPADQRVLRARQPMAESLIVSLFKWQRRLNRGEPLQYITGQAPFLDHVIEVNPSVLIPRPETESLVLWIREDLPGDGSQSTAGLRMLDVGTGSGCMAIALASLFRDAKVFACDKSEQALYTAKRNAVRNQVEIEFSLCDILSASMDQVGASSLDVLVSNPPYVRESEKRDMSLHVKGHEPAMALFVPDDDPLIYYEAICKRAAGWLRPGGRLYFEINEAMGREMVQLVSSHGFRDVTLHRDIHGRDRHLGARKG